MIKRHYSPPLPVITCVQMLGSCLGDDVYGVEGGERNSVIVNAYTYRVEPPRARTRKSSETNALTMGGRSKQDLM